MTRHFVIVLGSWKFENWRLYRYRQHTNKKGNAVWHTWDYIWQLI